jgi:sulfur transfer complex TusBCD TusB component (DsrH family)
VLRSENGVRSRYGSGVALRRPQHPGRVAVVAVIVLIAVNAAIFGTRNEVRGTRAPQRPTAVLALAPQEDDIALAQDGVVVTLKPNFSAQLSIDGRVIPDDQITIDTALNTRGFQPGRDKDITRFSPGTHTATIEYWPHEKSYEEARAGRLLGSYSWNFKVS